MGRRILLALTLVAFAACEEEAEGVPEEVEQARDLAARHACIAEELAEDAAEDLQILQQAFGSQQGSGTGEAAGAAATFARAFLQHAQLRYAAYAQTDSAFNHSVGREDSLRHEQIAARYEISAPEPGTLEANVIQSYDEKLARRLADPDLPCNWRHQLEEEEEVDR